MCFTIPKLNEYRRFTQTAKIMRCADDGKDHICSREKVILAICMQYTVYISGFFRGVQFSWISRIPPSFVKIKISNCMVKPRGSIV